MYKYICTYNMIIIRLPVIVEIFGVAQKLKLKKPKIRRLVKVPGAGCYQESAAHPWVLSPGLKTWVLHKIP